MTLLENWVHSPIASALGWTLVHSLWEGALVALLLGAALLALRSSRARYIAACVAMLALLIGFLLTYQLVWTGQGIQGVPAQTGALRSAPPALGDGLIVGNGLRFHPVDYLPWLAPLWFAGVLCFQVRGMASWIAARRLRRRGVCAATEVWQSRVDRLAARLRVSRSVVLLESCLAEVPVVIGYVRPVILMPVGLLTGLPAGQIESILLHELAHIRRHDYLVNLMQIVMESLVFYHPAMWWISGVMRGERENCCDDLVVATQGDAFAYAAALTALEQNRGTAREAVLAATGGSLVKRVRRLLIQPEGPRAALTPVFSAAILTITAAAAMAAWQVAPPPPRPPAAQAEAVTPYHLWLTQDVAYIISNDERRAFKSLQSDAEREHFIEQFWQRRDPTPGTVENEMKEEHYRRIQYVNAHFAGTKVAGWKTDRGRIYITYGPPDEKESHPSGNATSAVPFEQWLYRWIDGVGTNVVIEFIDPENTGEYRMTSDPSAKDVYAAAPKAGATVQRMLPGAVLISVPLTAYGNHKVTVYIRMTQSGQNPRAFEEAIQGPAALYTKLLDAPAGSYRFEIGVRDRVTGQLASDTLNFEMK